MDPEKLKASQFVQRLTANPALKSFSLLQKENQILQFLGNNDRQLYPTLSSASFFPGKTWAQILDILSEALRNLIDRNLMVQLKALVAKLDFSFLAFLREQGTPVTGAGEEIASFEQAMLAKPAARKAFAGPFHAVLYGLTDRYVDEAYRRREYIHFELTKVQKLKMGKEEVKNMIKTSLLLKNCVHLLTVETSGRASQVVQPNFADKARQAVSKRLALLPEPLIASGVNANLSFLDDKSIETTSRFASIFAGRSENYVPVGKVDRGADTPDKSWFSIGRRNYKYYGFDGKMLDELYKTAGENGW